MRLQFGFFKSPQAVLIGWLFLQVILNSIQEAGADLVFWGGYDNAMTSVVAIIGTKMETTAMSQYDSL